MAMDGDGAGVILQPAFDRALRFVHDRRARRLLLEVGAKAAALNHEAVDHAVKDRAVVVTVAHVLEEVLDRLRRLGRIELQADGTRARAHIDLRIGGETIRRHRGGRDNEKKLEVHPAPCILRGFNRYLRR
jgi:hypothetical protein